MLFHSDTGRHVVSLTHLPDAEQSSLYTYSLMLSGEAATTNVIVFGLTQSLNNGSTTFQDSTLIITPPLNNGSTTFQDSTLIITPPMQFKRIQKMDLQLI